MKEIKLTQNKVALVDDEDYEYINQWKWYYSHGYAIRHIQINKKQHTITMPRIILNTPIEFDIDHINNNKLDNRKENLRSCIHYQNSANRNIQRNNKSGFRGVFWVKDRCKWLAYINHLGKHLHLGYFDNIMDAKTKRDEKAKEIFGEFARTE